MPSHVPPTQSGSDRAALIYTAGEDLWRAADALNEAKTKLRQAHDGIGGIQANKLQGMVEALASKVEAKADEAMAEGSG